MTDARYYEDRANHIADTSRRFLVAIHSGGIAITFATVGALSGKVKGVDWAMWPTGSFSIGLAIVGLSLYIAKGKSLNRKNAAATGTEPEDFDTFFLRNETYDAASLIAFVFGVVMGIVQLGSVEFIATTS